MTNDNTSGYTTNLDNEKARTNDGGINGNYYREVVTGDSIVYHPVAIIPDKREVTNDDNMHMASSIDSIPFTMVEDLQKTNFNFNSIITVKICICNRKNKVLSSLCSFFKRTIL